MRIKIPFILIISISSAVVLGFVSCASKPSETASETGKTEAVEEVQKEPEVQNFSDWQYKGFGKDVPESVKKYFDNTNLSPAVVNGVIVKDNNFVLFGKGSSLDQAIEEMEDSFEKHISAYEEEHEVNILSLTEEYWVKLNQDVWETGKPYMAVKVFEIN